MPDQEEQPAQSVWDKIRAGYAAWREFTKKKKKKKQPPEVTGRTSPRPVVPTPNAEQLRAIGATEAARSQSKR